MSRELHSLLNSQSEFAGSVGQRHSKRSPVVYREPPDNRSNKRRDVTEEKGSGTKVPEKLKELLDTGLLESFPVRYLRGPKVNSSKGLMGVIKGNGVICYCANCKGIEVVSPLVFEKHAGSGNKRPADYIYLENGKSMREILNACKNAAVDDLTDIIEISIGSSKPSTDVSCISVEATDADVAAASNLGRQVSGTWSSSASSQSSGKITTKDLRKHKLVWEEGVLEDGEVLTYRNGGKIIREGFKKGCTIVCACCSTEMSPSEFEAHAGQGSRRKPYNSIFTSDGISLHDLAVKLIRENRFPVREYDNLCSICKDGGNLVSCDSCPRSFHAECIELTDSANSKFCCMYCVHLFRDETDLNRNLNGGRVLKSRCRRQFQTINSVDYGCVLCRSVQFSKGTFDHLTIMICDQCEREYHVGCLKQHYMDDLEELPEGAWLCCKECKTIYATLEQLVSDSEQKLLELYLKLDTVDIKWKILSGRYTTSQSLASKQLLSKALAIFHDRFGSISFTTKDVDDLIPDMLYGRSYKQQNFEGMHCAVLIVDSSVVSAALFRIFGQELAELPLVASSSEFQGKGYFQILFSCIEGLLSSLNVKNLVLPAADDVESMWIQKFGFERMTRDQFKYYQMDNQLMLFSGISMLQKPVPFHSL